MQTVNTGRTVEPPARPYPESSADWGTYHSVRYRMTIPLPRPRAWRIDDHSRLELVAKEGSTHSKLEVTIEDEPRLVNHAMCEERARMLGLVPAGGLKTIEDAVIVGPEAYDTRVRVGIEAGTNGGRLVGHVLAFGGYVRKCLLVHLATEVGSEEDEATLSQRLALVRVRTLGGIKIDPLGAVPRVEERPPVNRRARFGTSPATAIYSWSGGGLRPPSEAPLPSLPGIACGEVVLRTTKSVVSLWDSAVVRSTTREAMRGRLGAKRRGGAPAPHQTRAKSAVRDRRSRTAI